MSAVNRNLPTGYGLRSRLDVLQDNGGKKIAKEQKDSTLTDVISDDS